MLELVEWIRVRPPLEDDSLTVPLYMRHEGILLVPLNLLCLTLRQVAQQESLFKSLQRRKRSISPLDIQ